MNDPWKHKGSSGTNKHNHSLILDEGTILCCACSKPVDFYNVPQHICGKKHGENLVLWND